MLGPPDSPVHTTVPSSEKAALERCKDDGACECSKDTCCGRWRKEGMMRRQGSRLGCGVEMKGENWGTDKCPHPGLTHLPQRKGVHQNDATAS